MVPAGSQKDAQGGSHNESKITFLKNLGHRCGTKGSQGLSRYPLKPKMEPKWCPNGTKNGATTHMIEASAVPQCSTEMREKLAYPQNSPKEREAGIPSEQPREETAAAPLVQHHSYKMPLPAAAEWV